MAARKKCRYGKLKNPKGRRVCKKKPSARGGRKTAKGGRKCRFGVVRKGRRKGQCLKAKRRKK